MSFSWGARARGLYGPRFWRRAAWLLIGLWLLVHIPGALSPWGLAFNSTASLERGVYLTRSLAPDESIRLGQIACFRYEEPTALAGRNYFGRGQALCKPVAALAGDTLVQRGNVLYREGPDRLPARLTEVAARDSKGRLLPQFFLDKPYQLKPGEVALVAGAKPNSLDSRYLGVFTRARLHLTAKPLWTIN